MSTRMNFDIKICKIVLFVSSTGTELRFRNSVEHRFGQLSSLAEPDWVLVLLRVVPVLIRSSIGTQLMPEEPNVRVLRNWAPGYRNCQEYRYSKLRTGTQWCWNYFVQFVIFWLLRGLLGFCANGFTPLSPPLLLLVGDSEGEKRR